MLILSINMQFRSHERRIRMYEPKYQPRLSDALTSLSGLRYDFMSRTRYKYRDDPDADPVHNHAFLEIFYNISSDVSFLVNGDIHRFSFQKILHILHRIIGFHLVKEDIPHLIVGT